MMSIPKMGPVVAIDGPAGTGKSSCSKRLAEALHFIHIDTGALYRALAYHLQQTVEPEKIQESAEWMARNIHLEFKRNASKNPTNRVFANGKDVTDFIRTPEMSMLASQISSIPGVRSALLGLQRTLGCQGKAILEGRDIGTVIFPDADVKFFLSATAEERAKRRLIELEASGADTPSFEELKAQMITRDDSDMKRAVAPLKKAVDAIEVDTSKMTLDEVVNHMAEIVKKKLGIA